MTPQLPLPPKLFFPPVLVKWLLLLGLDSSSCSVFLQIYTMALSVGTKFSSYEDLQLAIKSYESENFVNFYKKECKKIASLKKEVKHREFKEELVYGSIVFACVKNGKYKYRSTTGERPNQSTFRTGCEFAIKLRSLDGKFLTVTHHGPNHNHECTQTNFRHYPSQRRLDIEQTKTVKDMVKLDANKKLIQAHIEEDTDKVVLLKDIHNMSRKTVSACSQNTSELEELRQFVSDDLPSVYMEVVPDGNEVVGIFLQDRQMREMFEKFPEVLLVDATYKVNRRDMPLYAIVIIDGNMETHPVCFFLVAREDEATLRKMVQIFKEQNEKWTETRIVISDKDFTERLVFKTEMPEITMQICLFHVLRSFAREITTEKSNITSEQKKRLLEILQQIAYAQTENEYNAKHEQLKEFGRSVEIYFDQNWHPIREEWCETYKRQSFNFCTRTNNRIESMFQKIKSVVKSRVDLKVLVEQIFGLVKTLRQERSHSMIMDSMKVRTQNLGNEDSNAYQRILTPETFKLVEKELQKSESVKVLADNVVECNNKLYTVDTEDGYHCTCRFSASFKLPCRHVMALNKHSLGSAFLENMIHHRWTRSYFERSVQVAEEGGISVSEMTAPVAPKTLSYNQK